MKKRKKGVKLGRGQKSRKALYRSLIRAMVEHGSIETTEAKARFLKKKLLKLIKLAKEDNVTSRRRVYAIMGNDREVTDGIFKLVKKNFQKRKGGFTRIVRLPVRRGDGARLVKLEWVKSKVSGKKSTKGKDGENNKKSKSNKKKTK